MKKNAVGILTADGRLFVPVSSKRADVEARRDFLPLAGKCVRATGKVLGRGEWHAIDVERIEVLTHHTAD